MAVPIQTVRVDLAERGYDIQIGTGNLDQVGRFLAERGQVSHAVVITDENVQETHVMVVAESLAEASVSVDVVVVEPGEPTKSGGGGAGRGGGRRGG